MPNFRFSGLTKHGRLAFNAGPVYGFEDEDAVPYFSAMGWGEATEDPADLVMPIGELDISPFTIFGTGDNRNEFVMPQRAADAAEELGILYDQALTKARQGLDPRDPAVWQEA